MQGMAGWPAIGNLAGWPRLGGIYSRLILATPGLAQYFPLVENAGALTVRDLKTGATGTHSSGAILPGARPVVRLTPSTTYPGTGASITTIPLVVTATTNWTLECWIRPAVIPQPVNPCCIIANGSTAGGMGLAIYGGGYDFMYLRQGINWNTLQANPFVTGGIYHCAITDDGSTVRGYINGVQCGTTYATHPSTPGTASYIGSYSSLDASFKGDIGHVAIYSAALSAATLISHYAAGLTG